MNFPKYPEMHDERIAVIGAGPAGLSAGHFLSSMGYDVTVFEGNMEPGGMLVRGIPEFRLDREAVKKDIRKLQEAVDLNRMRRPDREEGRKRAAEGIRRGGGRGGDSPREGNHLGR